MYKDRHVPTCVRPILGRSLLTNHRIPNCINECTTKKRHDLLKSIPVHHYSQKNCLALFRGERAMKFNDNGSSSKDLLMTDSPSWCKLIYNWTLKHNGLSGHHQSWSYSSTALSGGFQRRLLVSLLATSKNPPVRTPACRSRGYIQEAPMGNLQTLLK